MDKILIVALSSALGGFIQAVTGFGSAIMIMIFLPLLFSMTAAPAVSDTITMILSFAMFWRYRKSVNIRGIFAPVIFYLAASTFVIRQSAFWDTRLLKVLFGLFLIVLAGYFFLFSDRLKIRATPGMNVCCAVLSGITGGLFGISGPPVSLYYLAASKTKEEYLGTMNAFFSIVVVFNILSRLTNGFITSELVPFMAIGGGAVLAGCYVGGRVSHRIELPVVRKCVYLMMIFAGAVTAVQGLAR